MILVSSIFGVHQQATTTPTTAGSFTPVQTTSQYGIYQYVSQSATSVIINNLSVAGTPLTMANFGSIGYATIEPNSSSNQENISFTGLTQNSNGTATLTGVSRGLAFVYPYAATPSLGRSHATNALVVFSNSAPYYSQFAVKQNNEIITGQWTFTNFPITASSSLASTTVAGTIQVATQAQIAAGTVTGSTGGFLALTSQYATSTSQVATTSVVVTKTNGKIDPSFLNGSSENYTFNGSTTFAYPPIGATQFGGTGANGAFATTTAAVIDLGNAAVVTKNYTSISITGAGSLSFKNPNTNGTIIVLKSNGNVTLTCNTGPCIDASGMGGAAGNDGYYDVTSPKAGTAGQNWSGGSNSAGTGGGGGGGALTAGSNGQGLGSPGTNYGVGGATTGIKTASTLYFKTIKLSTGAGSGAGATSGGGAGGAGNAGGGSIYIECSGTLNFTTSNGISVAGKNGTDGSHGGDSNNGGGGGGGGAGSVIILYNSLTSNTGTINVSGGNGGNGGAGPVYSGGGGGGGGAGYSLVTKNTEF